MCVIFAFFGNFASPIKLVLSFLPFFPLCLIAPCIFARVILRFAHMQCCPLCLPCHVFAESCNLTEVSTEVLIILPCLFLLMMHIFVSKNNSWNMFLANSVWIYNNHRHRQVQQCLPSRANILYQHFIFTNISNNEEG